MNSIKHRFTLDMYSSQSQVCIPARLGDTNRSLHINLSEGGSPYFIETGSLAKLSIKRPTGTRIEDFCEIKDNSTVIYHFSQNENTCAVEGIHDCDVTLYGPNGELIASPRFSMVVSERVTRSDDINLSDEDRTAMDALLSTEALRQEAEKGRVDAETSRVNAETSRVNAETERVTKANEKINEMDTMIAEVNKKVEGYGGFFNCELPQEWVDINKAYEAAGEPGHKLMGGIIYKDFDGNIKVYPLSPAYGVRFDECGKKLPSVVVYNSAQQIMAKPATDGRHTVCLRQLDEFFGGGSTSDLGEKASSLQKIPPVDLTNPIVGERSPYVFCRDTRNNFAPKYYHEDSRPDTLIERDPYGRALVKAPDAASNIRDDLVVNVDYLTRILNQKLSKYLPLSGGTMTGTHTIQKSNPAYKLVDTSDNTTAYVQLYQGLLRLGYTWAKSLTVDKNGNVGVVGTLSCSTPTADGHAVTLGYLNNGVVATIADLARRLNAIADSDDITLDQFSEFIAYIKSNRSLIESITTSKVSVSDIVDNLTSTATDKPLSALQGKKLKELIDNSGFTTIDDMPLHYNYAVTLSDASIENMIKPDATPYTNSFRTSDFSRTPKVGDIFSLIFTDRHGNKGYSFAEITAPPNDSGFTPFKIKQTAMLHNGVEIEALKTAVETLKTEDWTFTLEDGSTVTKKVYLK